MLDTIWMILTVISIILNAALIVMLGKVLINQIKKK